MQVVALTTAVGLSALMWQVWLEHGGDHADTHRWQPAKHAAHQGSIMDASDAVHLGMALCCHVSLVCCPCCVLESNDEPK